MCVWKRLTAALPLTFCFVSQLLASEPKQAASAPGASSAMTPPPMTMPMPNVAPLFIENADFTSTLVLVNGAAVQTPAAVTVRDLSGKTVAMKTVQLAAHSQQKLSVRTLLTSAGAGGTNAGSITVMQNQTLSGMVFAAALSITNTSSSPVNYLDEELAMPTAQSSQMLEAVANKGEGSPILAVTSLSMMTQHVSVQCFGKNGILQTQTIELAAGATVLTDSCSENPSNDADLQTLLTDPRLELRTSTGLMLTSDAMPGSFAAFALAPHTRDDRKYFSSVAFTDPMMLKSSTTLFTGVPVGPSSDLPAGRYVPTLALANFSKSTEHVTVRFAKTTGGNPDAHYHRYDFPPSAK